MSEPVRVWVAHIIVECTRGHEDKPYRWVLTRQPGAQGNRRYGRVWVDTVREAPLARMRSAGVEIDPERPVRRVVVTKLDAEGNRTTGVSRLHRRKFQFKCPRCRDNLSEPAEKIEPVLDIIADSRRWEIDPGVSQISITRLRYTLTEVARLS